jgi:hypothetical protein
MPPDNPDGGLAASSGVKNKIVLSQWVCGPDCGFLKATSYVEPIKGLRANHYRTTENNFTKW